MERKRDRRTQRLEQKRSQNITLKNYWITAKTKRGNAGDVAELSGAAAGRAIMRGAAGGKGGTDRNGGSEKTNR